VCRHRTTKRTSRDRKAADEFRDQAVLEQVLRLDVAEDLALLAVLRRYHLGAKADRARPAARRNDPLESRSGASAQASLDLGVHQSQLRGRVKALADDPQHAKLANIRIACTLECHGRRRIGRIS
jgi:hypothetical protein